MVPKNTLRHSDTSPEAHSRRCARSNPPRFTPETELLHVVTAPTARPDCRLGVIYIATKVPLGPKWTIQRQKPHGNTLCRLRERSRVLLQNTKVCCPKSRLVLLDQPRKNTTVEMSESCSQGVLWYGGHNGPVPRAFRRRTSLCSHL